VANLRDFLEPRAPVTLDAPTRDPAVIQQGKPPGPQRLTRRELRRVAGYAAASGAPPVTRVAEINRFPELINVPFSLATAGVAGAQLIVPAPANERIILTFRNAAASAGTLFIGFGVQPNVNNAAFSLVAGGQLIFDVVVPQNDIWIACDAATTFGVVCYANADFNV
jgi:hypothetical protein